MSVVEKKMKGSLIDKDSAYAHQIIPIKYHWAREYYKTGIANTWTPEEISMHLDILQWQSKDSLTAQEKKIILWSLSFFSTAESLTANNIVLALYKYVNNPECRQYMLRQAFEEALHTDTFIYCCDSLALDLDMVYGAYNNIPSIRDKDEFVINLTKDILNPHFTVNSVQDMQTLVKNIIGFYVIMEGIFFYAGFAQMLYLRTKNKMVGVAQQFEYIMRDESIHLAFGCDLINTIKKEHPAIWTKEFQEEITVLIKQAVAFETAYIYDSMSIEGEIKPILFVDYIEYIADKRFERLDLPFYYMKKNPFPWMSTATDLPKEKNFFETKVTEYQTGSALEW